VAASLLKTAAIEQRLDDSPAARKLYQQVIEQFPSTPAAAAAQAAINRLTAG
jgi:TolA-binding protein